MGEIIPFPVKKADNTGEQKGLTDYVIREKIPGEAELIGVFKQNGFPCSCYRMELDNQAYYVFDLTTPNGE